MAIDTSADTTQIDKNGFAFRKASQIIQSEIDQVRTHTDLINDFSTGSITRTLIESEAIEIEKLYYYTLENLRKSIDDAVTSAFGFTHKSATYAFGDVFIRLNGTLQQDLVVDRGTRFYSTNPNYEQVYRTMVPYRVPKGAKSFTIPVYCTVIGSYGNIPDRIIDRTTDIGGIAEVYNPEAFNTGEDEENPQQAKVRFRQMIQSLARGTSQSLKYIAESVSGVAGANVYESTYGAVVVYAHDANGNLGDDLKQQIADRLVDYKPAGIKVMVYPTHKSVVALDVTVRVDNADLLTNDFLALIKQNLANYINSLTVGEPLYKANIIQKIMDTDDLGLLDTTVDVKVYPDRKMLNNPGISDDTIINIKGAEVKQPYLRPTDITQEGTYGILGRKSNKLTEQDGVSWKDSIVKDKQPEQDEITEGLDIDDVYRTNSNEILRLAICNIKFKQEANEADPTVLINDKAPQDDSLPSVLANGIGK